VLRVRLRPNPLSELQTPVRPLCSNDRSVGHLYRRIVPTFGLLFVALDPNRYYCLDHKVRLRYVRHPRCGPFGALGLFGLWRSNGLSVSRVVVCAGRNDVSCVLVDVLTSFGPYRSFWALSLASVRVCSSGPVRLRNIAVFCVVRGCCFVRRHFVFDRPLGTVCGFRRPASL